MRKLKFLLVGLFIVVTSSFGATLGEDKKNAVIACVIGETPKTNMVIEGKVLISVKTDRYSPLDYDVKVVTWDNKETTASILQGMFKEKDKLRFVQGILALANNSLRNTLSDEIFLSPNFNYLTDEQRSSASLVLAGYSNVAEYCIRSAGVLGVYNP